jgi:hypothetical protein
MQQQDETIAYLQEQARRIRVHVAHIAGMSDCHTGGSLHIPDRKDWSDEARACDALVVLSPEIVAQAARAPAEQGRLL